MEQPPKLLRVPVRFESVEHVLKTAAQMELTNILILSQRENGNLVFLDSPGLTCAEANWMVDQAKRIILGDEAPVHIPTGKQ